MIALGRLSDRLAGPGGNVVSLATYGETNDYSIVIKNLMAIDASEQRLENLRALPRNSIEFIPRRRRTSTTFSSSQPPSPLDKTNVGVFLCG